MHQYIHLYYPVLYHLRRNSDMLHYQGHYCRFHTHLHDMYSHIVSLPSTNTSNYPMYHLHFHYGHSNLLYISVCMHQYIHPYLHLLYHLHRNSDMSHYQDHYCHYHTHLCDMYFHRSYFLMSNTSSHPMYHQPADFGCNILWYRYSA